MWQQRDKYWIKGTCLVLAMALGSLSVASRAAGASSLSRWLQHEASPELRELLSRHPRFAGQRIQIVGAQADALSESIALVLSGQLGQTQGVRLLTPSQSYSSGHNSIDALDCAAAPGADYLLWIRASQSGAARGRVQITLLPADQPDEQLHNWHWTGVYSSAERRYLANAGAADGSLASPWSETNVDAAALALSRDFACALRPGVITRLGLNWPEPVNLPALFSDTFLASRHLLGRYPELVSVTDKADYTVGFRLERFRDDVWQLWLVGSPQRQGLAPVQAVAYFRATEQEGPVEVDRAMVNVKPVAPVPSDLGEAVEFIDVQVIDATQTDRKGSQADLQVTLRLGNRSKWPMRYSFTLSGGHFNHCIARPGNYRHDRYGSVDGSLEPGDSVVRRLFIEKIQHRPAPLFGKRKCAGFRDLDGFEKFAVEGHKVTNYVRWNL